GWIPAADVQAGDLSSFDEPGPPSIEGVVQLSQTLSNGRQAEVDTPRQQWYRVDVEAIQGQIPYKLLPFYLLQTPPDGVQDVLPYRVAAEIDLSEGPHLGYAIQWFLFAAVLAVGYGRFVSTHDTRD
ncbi:MAG: SURF1 family protein, partial [Chloroflexota bacterium]